MRQRIGMDDQPLRRAGRQDARQAVVSADKGDERRDALRHEDGPGIHVLADVRAVRRPDGIAGLVRKRRRGRDQGAVLPL